MFIEMIDCDAVYNDDNIEVIKKMCKGNTDDPTYMIKICFVSGHVEVLEFSNEAEQQACYDYLVDSVCGEEIELN
jgi:hypothetical protein